jgi:lipopolysaccharide export system protein LptA
MSSRNLFQKHNKNMPIILRLFSVALIILLFPTINRGAERKEEKPYLRWGNTTQGENARANQPLRIASDQMEADHKKSMITFTGSVVARQGEMTIYADQTTVFYEKKPEGNEVREIVATGNVKIHQGDQVATAQKGVFFNGEQKIVLTGQPKVWQGKDTVSGEKITFLLAEDKSFVEGGAKKRVEVILYPKEKQNRREGKP